MKSRASGPMQTGGVAVATAVILALGGELGHSEIVQLAS